MGRFAGYLAARHNFQAAYVLLHQASQQLAFLPPPLPVLFQAAVHHNTAVCCQRLADGGADERTEKNWGNEVVSLIARRDALLAEVHEPPPWAVELRGVPVGCRPK